MNDPISQLPIQLLIPDLINQLNKKDEVILEAAPGAGKTTVVPLALMSQTWLKNRKIVMLEPRRLAAKRLADTLNEPVGKRIGYRIRHDNKESQETQVLVVTEGVLTRMLQDDPSLDDVALVIFDEFHERNLHSDLAFALCLQTRELYRDTDPLKLLVMSATLDTQILEERLNCQSLTSQGRSFPVDIKYSNKALKTSEVIDEVGRLTAQAFQEETGNILVFLPGQKEIRTVQKYLKQTLSEQQHLLLCPLYGDLSLEEQEKAISNTIAPNRKIVLSTALAQTCLTIDGIRIVIDSGLSREARFDANTATTRLHTRKATQAETTQRTGRAGRTQEGICYRWWSEEQQHRLAPQAQPQIECVELSSLTLDLAQWGVQERLELDWITPPPESHFQQSLDLLRAFNAIEQNNLALTPHGEQMSALSLEPRLAQILLFGKMYGETKLACQTCAILSEGDPLSERDSAFQTRLNWLIDKQNSVSKKPKHLYQKSYQQWKNQSTHIKITPQTFSNDETELLGIMFASAFSDRIAKRVHSSSSQQQKTRYKLANGRIATLETTDSHAREDYLIAIEIGGHKDKEEDIIYLAHTLDLALLEEILPHLFEKRTHLAWSKPEKRIISEEQVWIRKLCIASHKSKQQASEQITTFMLQHIRDMRLTNLPWEEDTKQLLARIQFANQYDTQSWPDVSDTALIERLDNWLRPYLGNITSQTALDKLPLRQILLDSLTWEQQNQLSNRIPEKVTLPSGNQHRIDYTQTPPKLSAKLQEVFGMTSTPKVCEQNLTLELLSPAQRPLAITHDLPFFWQQTYPEIKKEMRGRYPKHPWPDDPLNAQATAKTNKALRSS